MRAPVSIIIPTLNAADELPQMLACLIEGLDSGVVRELIFSDGGSTDETVEIAREVGARVVSGTRGRGGQLARGARVAGGDWMLFLHADTHLSAGWAKVVGGHVAGSKRAGYFRLRFRARGAGASIVATWANFRSRLGLPYGDQGLLVSRALYEQVGGYSEIALMEDVAISRRLKGRLVVLNSCAATSAARYLKGGWFRRGASNIWTLVRYFAGTDPEDLVRLYRGSDEPRK